MVAGQRSAQAPLDLLLPGDVEGDREPGLAIGTGAPAQPAPGAAPGAVPVLEVDDLVVLARQLLRLLDGALAIRRMHEIDERAGHELLPGPAEEPLPARVQRGEVAARVPGGEQIALDVEGRT